MAGTYAAGAARDRLVQIASAVAILGALAAMITAAVVRGMWLDEVWTLWMSQRDAPLVEVFRHRWTQDVHPFTFFMLNWVMRPVLGESLLVRRLLNLIPLALFLATTAYLASRSRRFAAVAWIYAPLVMSNAWAIGYFAEYRSYFTVLCCTAALLGVLYCAIEKDAEVSPRQDPALGALVFGWALASLVVHYVATLLVGSFLAVVFLDLLRRRRFGWAGLLGAAGLLALGFLSVCLFEQRDYLLLNGPRFWIRTSPIKCIHYFAALGSSVLVANPVAALAVAAAVASAGAIAIGRGARLPRLPTANAFSLRFILLIGVAAAVAMAVVLGVDAIKPIAAARYLISLEAIAASLVAVAAADILRSRRWLQVAFAVNVVAAAALETADQAHDHRWNFFIDRIRSAVAACPGARVYGVDESFVSDFPYPANEPEVEAWGYQYVARTRGLTIDYLEPRQSRPIVLAQGCPTLIWGAHIDKVEGPRELQRAPFNRDAPPGFAWSRARLVTDAHENPIETGFLYIIPAPALSSPVPAFTLRGVSATS